MCLFKTHKFPKIALKDIIVYKILYKDLTTFHTREKIKIGETYKGVFKEYDVYGFFASSPTFIKSLFSNTIDTGYIHSYRLPIVTNNMLVKCIIPKGTLYFKNKKYGEYASRKLKYVEIIQP